MSLAGVALPDTVALAAGVDIYSVLVPRNTHDDTHPLGQISELLLSTMERESANTERCVGGKKIDENCLSKHINAPLVIQMYIGALISCCAVARAQHLGQHNRFAQQSPRGWLRAAQNAILGAQHFSLHAFFFVARFFSPQHFLS